MIIELSLESYKLVVVGLGCGCGAKLIPKACDDDCGTYCRRGVLSLACDDGGVMGRGCGGGGRLGNREGFGGRRT